MPPATQTILDLTRDLHAAVNLGTSTGEVNELLGRAIDTLGRLVPFDLATVMELRGEKLRVRGSRSSCATIRRAPSPSTITATGTGTPSTGCSTSPTATPAWSSRCARRLVWRGS